MGFKETYGGQWTLEADDDGYSISNRDKAGEKRFYEVTAGPYGNPVITAEPDLAFDAPSGVNYVDAKGESTEPDEQIAGIICKKDGEVVHRFSLSSPNQPDMILNNEGAVLVIQGIRWHLRSLFRKDKNRIINFDAFYGDEEPEQVIIVELEDLDL